MSAEAVAPPAPPCTDQCLSSLPFPLPLLLVSCLLIVCHVVCAVAGFEYFVRAAYALLRRWYKEPEPVPADCTADLIARTRKYMKEHGISPLDPSDLPEKPMLVMVADTVLAQERASLKKHEEEVQADWIRHPPFIDQSYVLGNFITSEDLKDKMEREQVRIRERMARADLAVKTTRYQQWCRERIAAFPPMRNRASLTPEQVKFITDRKQRTRDSKEGRQRSDPSAGASRSKKKTHETTTQEMTEHDITPVDNEDVLPVDQSAKEPTIVNNVVKPKTVVKTKTEPTNRTVDVEPGQGRRRPNITRTAESIRDVDRTQVFGASQKNPTTCATMETREERSTQKTQIASAMSKVASVVKGAVDRKKSEKSRGSSSKSKKSIASKNMQKSRRSDKTAKTQELSTVSKLK